MTRGIVADARVGRAVEAVRDLVHLLRSPACRPEDASLDQLLDHLEEAPENPAVPAIRALVVQLSALPGVPRPDLAVAPLPGPVVDALTAGVTDWAAPGSARLRLWWVIDALLDRLPTAEPLVRTLLEYEQDPAVRLHLWGETLPRAIVHGPRGERLAALQALAEAVDPEALPGVVRVGEGYWPAFAHHLSPRAAEAWRRACGVDAELRRQMAQATVRGRFSADRWAERWAEREFEGVAPLCLVQLLLDPSVDDELQALAVRALSLRPESVDELLSAAGQDAWGAAAQHLRDRLLDARTARDLLA